ncbi:MAG: hypothetical protein QXI68_04235 [Sulfolobales archaeon]
MKRVVVCLWKAVYQTEDGITISTLFEAETVDQALSIAKQLPYGKLVKLDCSWVPKPKQKQEPQPASKKDLKRFEPFYSIG